MSNAGFYAKLSETKDFAQITSPDVYIRAPRDWFVIITDVRGSTKAIQAGRYKAVNCVGAATIMSILNLNQTIEIPYAFGGDGATLLLPPELRSQALEVLGQVREMAKKDFDLVLRIGCVPISVLEEQGHSVSVAKFRTSSHVHQAAFLGSGLAQAEALIKDARADNPYLTLEASGAASGLEGLECRWQPIQHKNGEIVSLVIKACSESADQAACVYDCALAEIQRIYGSTDQLNPVRSDGLKLTLSLRNLMHEARLRTQGEGFLSRLKYVLRIWVFNVLWIRVFKKRAVLFGVDWGRYKDEVILNSDYRKFDGTLRMVIDGEKSQRAKLIAYLDRQQKSGELFYGIHTSDSALITCLIFNREGNHIHLVDGNNGGYALAAQQLKDQIKAQASAAVVLNARA